MTRRKRRVPMLLALAAMTALAWGTVQSWSQSSGNSNKKLKYINLKPTTAEKKAAAGRAAALGLKPGVAGLATPLAAAAPLPPLNGVNQGPGGVPHYFGPYGNWAYSPLPVGNLNAALTVDAPGIGYTAPVITITDAYDSTKSDTASATLDATGAITAIALASAGTGYTAPVVTITDATGTGAAATATLNVATLSGGMRKFVDSLPQLGLANNLGQYIPLGVKDIAKYPGSDYYEIAVVEYNEQMHSDLPASGTKMRGYVQIEPPGSTTTPAGSKHVLLTGVTYNGQQVYGYDKPHFLGPVIVAQGAAHGVASPAGSPVPVRIKFYNLLPTGAAGNLFLPVDETIAGAGVGPALPGTAGSKYTQNRATIHNHGNNTVWISDGNTHQWITPATEITPYPKGVSAYSVPDMKDTAGNVICSAANSGCQTFFYTNAQSARLMFYHDHAMGITRLNVIAGEAAGYVITDAVESDLINGTNVSGINGVDATGAPIPGTYKKVLPDIGIPLVIQDRTFVDANTIFAQDPTWNWGTGPKNAAGNITGAVTGDLWYPHVYMSAENPWDLTGTNPFGRWMYGPWFNPPVPTCVNGGPVGCIDVGPIPNEYHQADCDLVPPGPGCTAPWEPPMRPGVPNPSIAGEGFLDTPIVNGTAYPYLVVEPKAYRFRVLNAANDRMFNLQLYVAADKTGPSTVAGAVDPVTKLPVVPTLCTGSATTAANCTEVAMRLMTQSDLNQVANTPSGLPIEANKGPDWIQIGTEGGFLPAPVVVPQQPVGWNMDATVFNVGNVNQHSLLLGSAERADVVVDFTAFAGKTLILYNDAPAAFPAGVATYDYFTGVANQMDVGGAPTTQPGYGPNTRTIMQIRVGTTVSTPTTDVTLANLQAAFAKTATKRGVFEVSQDPVVVPQTVYNSAYNATFPTNVPEQFGQIADTSKTFKPIDPATGQQVTTPVTLPFEMKAMHDEMSGVYDTMFGRMSGMLGDSLPTSPVHVLLPYPYSAPPTDLVQGSVPGTPVAVLPDGTQIWRIFHNGVDTHTIHTHLFHSQLLNRVSQDGLVMMPPDPEERGWKDTFRINPLEITYLAMRPTIPTSAELPFEVPDSIRLIDPTLPEGATLPPPAPAGWFDPTGVGITEILNHKVNFGWEYVWHCHILAHEEMDMMHSLVFAVPPLAPTNLSAAPAGTTNNPRVNLSWTDNSIKELKYVLVRATDANFSTGLTTIDPKLTTTLTKGTVNYQDTTVVKNTKYWYKVAALGNTVGDTQAYPAPSVGFPTMAADSISNVASVQLGAAQGTPTAPTGLTAALQSGPQVSLTWKDNATNETGFAIMRCTGAGCTVFAQIATAGPKSNTGNVTFVDTTVQFGNSYSYQVVAVNGTGSSAPSNTVTVVIPAIPAAPTSFTIVVTPANGNKDTAALSWGPATWPNPQPTSFTIERANNLTFTTGLTTFTVAGTARTLSQSVSKNTVYYYRIKANNQYGGSSNTVNALPFPVLTP